MRLGVFVAVALTAVVVGVHSAQLRGEAPMYRGVGGSGSGGPSVSVLEGLPAYSPSTMPTRYYDSTEYDVAPFVTPLNLPTPPPPPAFVQTASSASMWGQAGNAQSIAAAATMAASAAARQQQMGGMALQQQQQRYAAPAMPSTPLMRYRQQMQAMQQMQSMQQMKRISQAPTMAPALLLQESSAVHQNQHQRQRHHAKAHNKAKAHTKAKAKHHGKSRAKHHAHQRHNARHHLSAQAAQAMRQRAFEESASRMRFSRHPVEQPEPVLMETTSRTLHRGAAMHRSRAELEATNRALQQQLSVMQQRAAAWQKQREAQAAYLNAPHDAERAAAMAARPQQPFLAEAPESIAARGYVPHFAPLVRALPSAQPVQPYAGFFEANAQMHPAPAMTSGGPYAGRPQEPFLPRLPPPPIALGE